MVPLVTGQPPAVIVPLRLGLAKPQHQKEKSLLVQGISQAFRPASSGFSVVASSSPATNGKQKLSVGPLFLSVSPILVLVQAGTFFAAFLGGPSRGPPGFKSGTPTSSLVSPKRPRVRFIYLLI